MFGKRTKGVYCKYNYTLKSSDYSKPERYKPSYICTLFWRLRTVKVNGMIPVFALNFNVVLDANLFSSSFQKIEQNAAFETFKIIGRG